MTGGVTDDVFVGEKAFATSKVDEDELDRKIDAAKAEFIDKSLPSFSAASSVGIGPTENIMSIDQLPSVESPAAAKSPGELRDDFASKVTDTFSNTQLDSAPITTGEKSASKTRYDESYAVASDDDGDLKGDAADADLKGADEDYKRKLDELTNSFN